MAQQVKQQLGILAALQMTEIEMAKIERALSGVDARIEALGARLIAYRDKLELEKARLEAIRKQYREDESETRSIDGRILKDNEKLRAVKTNKEYQSMLKEIDELEKKRSLIEDRMLTSLEHIEQAEKGLVSLQKEMESERADIEQQQAEIVSQAENEKQALTQCRMERESIYTRLEPQVKKMFAKVKAQGRDIAVAAVVEGFCQVCRMGIPPQMFNELLRMDSIRLCPNCQRIIYPKIMIEPDGEDPQSAPA